jgi:hypothetical protein
MRRRRLLLCICDAWLKHALLVIFGFKEVNISKDDYHSDHSSLGAGCEDPQVTDRRGKFSASPFALGCDAWSKHALLVIFGSRR